jgi:hypothetical protein
MMRDLNQATSELLTMPLFDYVHAIRFLVSNRSGGMNDEEIYRSLCELRQVDDIAIDTAIAQIVASGEMTPLITPHGKIHYVWEGGEVQN